MNLSPAWIVVAITGAILIGGTALQIATSSHRPERKANVVFEAPVEISKPSAEPLFPGIPDQ